MSRTLSDPGLKRLVMHFPEDAKYVSIDKKDLY
jgi:hypothetical protein